MHQHIGDHRAFPQPRIRFWLEMPLADHSSACRSRRDTNLQHQGGNLYAKYNHLKTSSFSYETSLQLLIFQTKSLRRINTKLLYQFCDIAPANTPSALHIPSLSARNTDFLSCACLLHNHNTVGTHHHKKTSSSLNLDGLNSSHHCEAVQLYHQEL